MSDGFRLHLFEGYGIELEYMIVDRATLKVRPICDKILEDVAGEPTSDIELGEVAWSNELVMHVIEAKSNGPAKDLVRLHQEMSKAIVNMNKAAAEWNCRLLPTAMHPLFDPETETKLWVHDNAVVYNAYDKIFNCQGHGWSNLQSIHINLPFYDDKEFGKLHAAIRLVLPILPTLAASSPFVGGKRGPYLDSRLHFYLQNQRRIPSILGLGIPERVFTKADYEEKILKPMWREISPQDPEGILQHEWLNSRAAIARFMRNAIEIRLLDIQECPKADFTIISAVVSLIQSLVEETCSTFAQQSQIAETSLRGILDGVLEQGSSFIIEDKGYLATLGLSESLSVKDLWTKVGMKLESTSYPLHAYKKNFEMILEKGCLSERILRATGTKVTREVIIDCYSDLGNCLIKDQMFNP
ncbi:MAG: glutamate-cysteine ligase family protein [Oligoflexales bacterium]